MVSELRLDFETFSEAELSGMRSVGLSRYMRDMSTEALMVGYAIDSQKTQLVDLTQDTVPPELREALLDPAVEKWAFNSSFERLVTRDVLRIDTPYEGWRCTQALASLQSFAGGLLQVGEAMGLEGSLLKSKEGDRLIKLFSMPQRITKKNILDRRTRKTDPEDWELFCAYCMQDVDAENAIKKMLFRFPIRSVDWSLYELDQRINDRGLPVNRQFVEQAARMSTRRKLDLNNILRDLTGLKNPNSTQQLLPWLQARGYPFGDLQKFTVAKVLNEQKRNNNISSEAVSALKLRQNANKASVKKYDAILRRADPDNRLRHCFQYAGAQRTARWAGRGPQPHNLTRTPKVLEAEDGDASKLEAAARTIQDGNYDTLCFVFTEPMVALSGSVRSSFQAEDDCEFTVADLSAIESAVSAWLSKCERLLQVFRDGRDPYCDFGTGLYHEPYAAIKADKAKRTICKPVVLGASYQLGGGELIDGKKTGLWGYAENMGVDLAREEAHLHVKLFRELYAEIPILWKLLERAVVKAMNGTPTTVNGLLHFEMNGPYMTVLLPSGRYMYYYKPRMVERTFQGRDGPYTRTVFSYMGRATNGQAWQRVYSSGGKLMENCFTADTLVITQRGWLPIVDVLSSDLLWDGDTWVRHGGVVHQGKLPVISLDGVFMTYQQKVLTTRGWSYAENANGLDREPVSLPDGYGDAGLAFDWKPQTVVRGSRVCLRKKSRVSYFRVEKGQAKILRLFAGVFNPVFQNHTRYVPSSGLCGLAFYGGSLPIADTSSLAQLRWARHNSLRRMGTIIRGFLARYGSVLQTRFVDRTQKQQRSLFGGKLQVGNAKTTSQQQTYEYSHRHALGIHDRSASISEIGNKEKHFTLPAIERLSDVYDILNTGPRHQFVVAGKVAPLIVHNCVQATSRDILGFGMLRADTEGFNIVGHVHDEIITMQRKGENRLTLALLNDCMKAPIPWAKGLPLGAAGYTAEIYRKD